MKNNAARIVALVTKHSGTTSVGLLAGDLGLSVKTVKRHVDALITAGRIEIGHDGNQLEVTAAELHEQATDARVSSHR